ncbi:hypothetical protein Nmel_004524 [Mimus melanotis]
MKDKAFNLVPNFTLILGSPLISFCLSQCKRKEPPANLQMLWLQIKVLYCIPLTLPLAQFPCSL